MKRTSFASLLCLLVVVGCSSSKDDTSTDSGNTNTDTGTNTNTDGSFTITDVRGDRYCEILVGYISGGNVSFDVYNTYQLNECPEADWEAIDPEQVKSDQRADVIVMNGPRFWLMDSFVATPTDTDTEMFGTIEMYIAGVLVMPVAEVVNGGIEAYAGHTVNRTTVWTYNSGSAVYELTDADGNIYDMQSYTTKELPQTEASLANLGDVLEVPTGWSFNSRVLDAQLDVAAVAGEAHITQDENDNTYQMSQQ
jgi:hypothetical protein